MTTSSVTMTETDAVNVRDQVRSIMNQKRKNKKMTSIYALFFPRTFFCMLMYLLKAALALASNPTDFIGQSEKYEK